LTHLEKEFSFTRRTMMENVLYSQTNFLGYTSFLVVPGVLSRLLSVPEISGMPRK
jgi:hypothetical protein